MKNNYNNISIYTHTNEIGLSHYKLNKEIKMHNHTLENKEYYTTPKRKQSKLLTLTIITNRGILKENTTRKS
jgi:hypothetical protein